MILAVKVALPIFDLSISERSIFHFDAGLSKKVFQVNPRQMTIVDGSWSTPTLQINESNAG